MIQQLSPILLALGLAACDGVPSATRSALSDFDVLATDVADLRFVVEQPQTVPLKVAATLNIGIDTPDGTRAEVFDLRAISDASPQGGLTQTSYSISPDDRARFAQAQQDIRTLKTTYPDDSKGTLSVGATGCLTGPKPEGRLPVSVYLAVSDDAPLLPVLQDQDLGQVARAAGVETIGPCDGA